MQSLVRRTHLAEISESLTRTMRQTGADVRVFLPQSIDLDKRPLANIKVAGEVEVADGEGKARLEISTALLGELPIVLIDHPRYFSTRHPYGDEEGPYADNWRRYTVFARAVLESLPLLKFSPDVLHLMIKPSADSVRAPCSATQ